jgi:hypothetical protein
MSAPGSATNNVNNMNQFSFSANASSNINPNLFSAQQMFADLTPPDSTNLNLGAFPLFNNDPSPATQSLPDPTISNPLDGQWAWDLVSLGMQEELPPEDLTNKL